MNSLIYYFRFRRNFSVCTIKNAVTRKELPRQLSRSITPCRAQKSTKAKAPRKIPPPRAELLFLARLPFPMGNLPRTEKASEQVFRLVHHSGMFCLLGFPMTDFRLDFAPLYIQRLVSLRVRTAFPFHRPYLDEKDAFCGMADTLCEYLIFLKLII